MDFDDYDTYCDECGWSDCPGHYGCGECGDNVCTECDGCSCEDSPCLGKHNYC